MHVQQRTTEATRRLPGFAVPHTQPYVLIPDPLIEAFARDPLAVGVYVAVARLALIYKGPVALSAAELAAWIGCPDEAERAAIMRRIMKLERAGWLIVTRSCATKHMLLPGWGVDRQGRPRPWSFEQPSLGRPDHLRGRRVPLALLDTYVGQLKPQDGRAPAIVSRYLTRPLLDLTDIGTYTIRLRTERAPTLRLTHLGLTTDVLPSQAALLTQAAHGVLTTIVDQTPIGVGLTAWGYDQLGLAPPAASQETARRSIGRSVGRSPNQERRIDDLPHVDEEKSVRSVPDTGNTWDVGMFESINSESSPNRLCHTGGGADRMYSTKGTGMDSFQEKGVMEDVPDQLHPQIVAGHRALNPERRIFPGEWWELLALQQSHGEQQLLVWQARAARVDRADVCDVRPAYYAACAAQAAIEQYRPRYRASYETTLPNDAVVVAAAPAPSPPARPALDAAADRLLRAMGIRERAQLAHVPVGLIEQWAAVLDHAGLAARFDDVRAFAHTQLRLQQPPPPRAELERWAERARERAAAIPVPALTDNEVAHIVAHQATLQAHLEAIAPADLTEDERFMLLADLEGGKTDTQVLARLRERRAMVVVPAPTPEQICTELHAGLRLALRRELWPMLERIMLQVAGEELRIVCRWVVDLGTVEAHIAPHIRVVLRDYAWQPQVRVVAQAPPPAQPHVPPVPPAWIAPEQWAMLPPLMQTALLGSTLMDEGLRCATPALGQLLRTRYAHELAVLLAARHLPAAPPITPPDAAQMAIVPSHAPFLAKSDRLSYAENG